MRQILSTRTYRAMYRLLDRVSPVDGDCGRLCGSICCTIGTASENPNSSDIILLQHIEDVNQQDHYKQLEREHTDAYISMPEESPSHLLTDAAKGGDEELMLGIYLYPGEESLFLPRTAADLTHSAASSPQPALFVFRNAHGTPQFAFETEDAEDYEYPDNWIGDVWFAHCLCAPHCERAMRPLQCRFYPVAPHINRRGELTLIWFFGASAGADEVPYRCPLIEERRPLNEDFLKATYTVCRHLARDPQIFDLFLFDSAWRRGDPDFDEDELLVYQPSKQHP